MDIIKKMCSQLSSSFYDENLIKENIAQDETNKVTYTKKDKDSTIVSDYISAIEEKFQNIPVSLSFNELDYYEGEERAQWSGTVADGIQWVAVYTPKENGFYITANNVKVIPSETKALLRLHNYFNTEWFTSIRKAILNNELGKK